MYKIIIERLFIVPLLIVSASSVMPQRAFAEFWNLPQELSPANTSITFDVDSTWHRIEGTVNDFNGKLWLFDKNDFRSIQGSVLLPVSALSTDNESRDEKLREVMNESQYPTVTFVITRFDAAQCDPKTLVESSPCVATTFGDLTINTITKSILLKTVIKRIGTAYQVDGTTSIKWADFKVKDPSIFIAKLYDDVNIHINLMLPYKK